MPDEPRDDEKRSFNLALPFNALECPECGAPEGGTLCRSCGVTLPEDPNITARQRALRGPADRATALLSRFDHLPEGVIPVTPDQFVAAIREADLTTKVGDIYDLGFALNELDLSDLQILGSEVRRVMEDHLDRVEGILDICGELAHFRPPPVAKELRLAAVRAGRYGAELASAMIAVFRAPSYEEAELGRDRVEKLWASFPLKQEFDTALAALQPWKEPDYNARIALALDREGHFTNDRGGVDTALVFAAFSVDEKPFESLAKAAEKYISYLLDGEMLDPGSGAALIGPLVMLASTERPLRAHKAMRLLLRALQEAFEIDPDVVRGLLQRSAAEGPTIYSALARVERAMGDFKENTSDEEIADRLLRSYRQLAETTFRAMGWLVLGIDALRSGCKPTEEVHPPMLGELRQRLLGSSDLGNVLAESVDVPLRNAEAHAQYRWVPEREVIRDWRTEQEWSPEDLEDALAELIACIAGSEAGFAAFVALAEIEDAPDWLSEGEVDEIYEVLAGISFGGRGLDVKGVTDSGGTVTIAPALEPDPGALLPALAGLVPFTPKVTRFRIQDTEGSLLIDVNGDLMRRSLDGREIFKGITVVACTYDSAVHTGMDKRRAGRELAALVAKFVAVTGRQELMDSEFAPEAFKNLNDRLIYAAELLKTPPSGMEIPNGPDIARRMGRIRGTALNASRGDERSLKRLLSQLNDLAAYADSMEIDWPPKPSAVS